MALQGAAPCTVSADDRCAAGLTKKRLFDDQAYHADYCIRADIEGPSQANWIRYDLFAFAPRVVHNCTTLHNYSAWHIDSS